MLDDEVREWIKDKRRRDKLKKNADGLLQALKWLVAYHQAEVKTEEELDHLLQVARTAIWNAVGDET